MKPYIKMMLQDLPVQEKIEVFIDLWNYIGEDVVRIGDDEHLKKNSLSKFCEKLSDWFLEEIEETASSDSECFDKLVEILDPAFGRNFSAWRAENLASMLTEASVFAIVERFRDYYKAISYMLRWAHERIKDLENNSCKCNKETCKCNK